MDNAVELISTSEADTCRLAIELSHYAGVGDFFGLAGDLGAGKSVFARALVRALAGNDELEVPSPTFTLVQTYEDLRIQTSHFDLYRIGDSAEVDELGLEDASLTGLVLVEWPERIDDRHFHDRLMIYIDDLSPEHRKITLKAHGSWRHRLARWHKSRGFLQQAGWGDARREFLQGDASHRRYERVFAGDRSAVLMDMPRQGDGPAIRDGKPYSALAHLAEDVTPFIAMTTALRSMELSAPEIYAAQPIDGFLLLEDFGSHGYLGMTAAGEDMTVPMQAAVDVLVHISTRLNDPLFGPQADDQVLAVYDRDALQIEVELLPDWYWPHVKNSNISPALRAEFLDLWHSLWAKLEEGPQVWTLRDYHSPNLIWLAERTGITRVGLLDYQDAVWGSPAYDLMSLLQDARRDVSEAVESRFYAYYWQQLERTAVAYDRDTFASAYAILGAQRATKILGIFARLAKRDHKPGYLAHMPRVRGYLERNLTHPHLHSLRRWFDHHFPASF